MLKLLPLTPEINCLHLYPDYSFSFLFFSQLCDAGQSLIHSVLFTIIGVKNKTLWSGWELNWLICTSEAIGIMLGT